MVGRCLTASRTQKVLLQFVFSFALGLVMSVFPGPLSAQNPSWNSTLVVVPNPSPYLSAWQRDPRIANFTLMYFGNSPAAVTFGGVLTGKKYGLIATVKGNTTQIASGPTTRIFRNTDILKIEEATYNNTVSTIVMKAGRLPEDQYTLCITTRDQVGNQLTQACASFSISLPDQPQLFMPVDKDTVPVPYPAFQWTPVLGAPGSVFRYAIRICEVFPGQQPEKALSANVPQFERIVNNLTMLVYPPDALPLTAGKRYAWQIQALDQDGAPATVNDGKSEIRTFSFKTPTLILNTPHPQASVNVTQVEGVLQYNWPGSSRPAVPLTGCEIKLLIEYVFHPDVGLPYVLRPGFGINIFTDMGKELASTTTDSHGGFTFSFMSSDSSHSVAKDTTIYVPQRGYLKGDVYRVGRVVVSSPYYLSPGSDIMFKSKQFVDAGTLTAKARRYDLIVQIWDPTQNGGHAKNGTVVLLYRNVSYPDLPADEGNVPDPRPVNAGWTLVARDSVESGQVRFDCLVQNRKPNDGYRLQVQSPNYRPMVGYSYLSINFDGQPNPDYNYNKIDNAVFVEEYGFPTLYTEINPKYVSSVVTGHLTYMFPDGSSNKPLAGVRTRLVLKYILHKSGGGFVDVSQLVNQPDANKELALATTDSTGRVLYFLSMSPSSFDSMGLIASNQKFSSGPIEFPTISKGDLYRVARVMIDNPYYCSPGSGNPGYADVALQSLNYQDFGTFKCLVRGFNYKLIVKDKDSQNPLNNIVSYILRIKRPPTVPADECGGYTALPKTKNYGAYTFEIVAKGVSSFVNNQKGTVIFTNLVKNDMSSTQDKYFLLLESDAKSLSNYKTICVPFKFDCLGEQSVYNDDYPANPTYVDNVTKEVEPLPPYVAATIKRTDTGLPVPLLTVYLSGGQGGTLNKKTDSAGYIKFDNLPGNPGPARNLYVVCQSMGFRDTTLDVLPLSKGQKYVVDQIPIYPLGSISGFVTDETGKPVDAYIGILGGKKDQTSCLESQMTMVPGSVQGHSAKVYTCTKYGFQIPAPTGMQKIVIEPVDHDKYLTTDTLMLITKTNQDVGKLIAYRKLHRLKINVATMIKGQGGSAVPQPVQNASIEFLNTPEAGTQVADGAGNGYFTFQNDATTFKVHIRGPKTDDYESHTFTIVDSCTKGWHEVKTLLPKAGHIAGTVFVGRNQVVDGAHVFMSVDGSPDVEPIETTTATNGTYAVHNVPLGSHTFYAVKGGTIGDSAAVIVSENGMSVVHAPPSSQKGKSGGKPTPVPVSSLDFHLTVYNDMDITRLLDLPVEITKLTPQPGTKAKISGRFVALPSNAQFEIDTAKTLNFDDVVIVPSSKLNGNNVPISRPESGTVHLNEKELELAGILQTFQGTVRQYGSSGTLHIDDANNNGSGILKGVVNIAAGSFHTGGAIGFPNDTLSLLSPGSGSIADRLRIPVVVASNSDLLQIPDGFNVSDASGRSLRYTLHTFQNSAIADSSASFATQGKLRLATKLHTSIPSITPSDLKLDIGVIEVTPSYVQSVQGSDEITAQLEQWQLTSSDWSFTNAGLVLHNGAIKTGLVDVPFTKDLPITPTKLETEKSAFDLQNLTLGGVIPLQISGDVTFVYDPMAGTDVPKGHWSLVIIPKSGMSACARIGMMPGMKQGDGIDIGSMYVLSNGETGFTTDPNAQPFTLYDVATFAPVKVVVFQNRVNIPGSLDVHIPLSGGGKTTSIDYYKDNNGNLAFAFDPIKLEFDTKGVHAAFPGNAQNPQTLDEKGFIARGTVSESGKYSFATHVFRTVDSTSIWLETGQSLDIAANASSKLTAMEGNMSVSGTDWTNLWFAGDLTGANGATGRLKFTVYGEIVADNQNVGVSNIPSPFGNITLTYDFSAHRLVGLVDFSQGVDFGPTTAYGTAEVLVDNDGWYFLGAATFSLAGFNSKSAFIIGNYPMTDYVKGVFAQYSWVYQNKGKLPPTFPAAVKGFFTEGQLGLPKIPVIGFNFLIIDAEVYIKTGGDMRFGIDFSKGASFGMGYDVYGEAGAVLGASVVIACAGVKASVPVDFALDGKLSTNGDWFIEGDQSIGICGAAYAGWGVCDSDCDGTLCDKHSASGCKYVGLFIHIGTDYNSVKPYLK